MEQVKAVLDVRGARADLRDAPIWLEFLRWATTAVLFKSIRVANSS